MSLTPVAPTGSGSVSGGLPSHAPGARSALRDRASVPRVLDAAPLGAGVRVPRLRRDRGVAHRARAVDVRGLWTSGVGDRGHHFPGDPYSVVRLVPGDLVGGQPKKWRQRAWPTARARLGQLPHGVDVLHKLRRAMVRPGRDRVSEEVEVDETLVGGLEAGGGRRHLGTKALVVIAAEVRGRAIGRIRMQRVADASADSLLTFVQHAVQPGSVVIHRRAPELPPPAQARLSPRPESAPWSWRVGRGGLASRPPGCVAPQALAPGYASGRRQSRASRLLPRRVHLSVQSTNLTPSREALPSAPGTGRGGGSRSLRGDGQGYPWSEEETPPQPVVGT